MVVGVTVSDLDRRAATVEDDDNNSGFETESSSVGSSANSDSGLEDELDEDLDEEFERSLSSFRAEDESLSERLYALKDMVSPSTRRRIVSTWNTSTSWAAWGGKAAGNAIWIATTSALLVGLPLALAIENETMMVQQEKEILAQQQGAQQMMGTTTPGQLADGVRPAGF